MARGVVDQINIIAIYAMDKFIINTRQKKTADSGICGFLKFENVKTVYVIENHRRIEAQASHLTSRSEINCAESLIVDFIAAASLKIFFWLVNRD